MNLIEELQALQHAHGYLREEDLRALSIRERVPFYEIEGVVSFYAHFRRTPPPRAVISACRDLSCHLAGAPQVIAQMEALAATRADVEFEPVSCLGRCDLAPACAVNNLPVDAGDIEAVLALPDGPEHPEPAAPRRWQVDPHADAGDHYRIARDFAHHPGDIIPAVEASGLRGRGGAAFPTAIKWSGVRDQPSPTKYIVCNADESEPGTFKDRIILEELPHLVIEGMVLAGLATGAQEGIVYLRHEYPAAESAILREIRRAEALGVLGDDACGSGRRFTVRLFISPGGYIMGEETALLEGLEGHRGEPRNKPPLPVHRGLHQMPTVINNVETLALVPSAVATRQAHLKFFSVSGDVENPGVYEVDISETTVAQLIGMCGGMKDGVPLLAIQPGGASTAFLPASAASELLHNDALRNAGSSLGSGGMVVIGAGRDMLELARNVTSFFRNESCGKCVPCRLGTTKAVALLERGQPGDFDLVRELQLTVTETSICGLGQAALIPAVSVLDRFIDPPANS